LARILIIVGAALVIVGGVITYQNHLKETLPEGSSKKDDLVTVKTDTQSFADEENQISNNSEIVKSPDNQTNKNSINQKTLSGSVQPPQFNKIKDIKARKKAFFEFLLPFVRQENKNIWNKRQSLIEIRDSIVKNTPKDPSILEKLQALAVEYKLDAKQKSEITIIEQLLAKIDVIPPGLVLAQAANESAWGTSRFAREGNNFFGQWCYKKGCGLIPKGRSKGMKHEVAKFDNAKKSVISYMRNLNIHPAYTELRKIRSKKRAENKLLDSVSLAKGLINYSERREAYVREIVEMIKFNKIDKKHPVNPSFL
jgi:Bax protein